MFFMSFTHVKCTDCGWLYPRAGSLKEMGMLDGNNCPNCGGEIILLYEGIKWSCVFFFYDRCPPANELFK